MKRRLWNRMRAWFSAYFWIPCPRCGQNFGGHEATGAALMREDGSGRLVCPDCAPGVRAEERTARLVLLRARRAKFFDASDLPLRHPDDYRAGCECVDCCASDSLACAQLYRRMTNPADLSGSGGAGRALFKWVGE